MWILSFLIGLLLILLLVITISTAMKIGLWITTRHHYDYQKLFVPALLIAIIWVITIAILYLCLKYILHLDMIDTLLSLLFNPSNIPQKFQVILTCTILFIFSFLLQSLTFYSLNIDYTKLFRAFKFHTKNALHIQENASKEHQMEMPKEKVSFSFVTALITNLLITLFSIISIALFYFIGTKIGFKIVN